MRQRPAVPGFALLLDPARGAPRRDLCGRCVPRGAVSEGARRGDHRMSRHQAPRPGSPEEVAWAPRARSSRGVPRPCRAALRCSHASRPISLTATAKSSSEIDLDRNDSNSQASATALPRTHRLRDHRGTSPATVRSRHARALSCSHARSPVTAMCAGATSGAPRMNLVYEPVYARHDCVAQRRLAPPSIPILRDYGRANDTEHAPGAQLAQHAAVPGSRGFHARESGREGLV